MIAQRDKITSPESPRIADYELKRGGWNAFLYWKGEPKGEPHSVTAPTKEAIIRICNRWVETGGWRP